jgi:hypothetical protein
MPRWGCKKDHRPPYFPAMVRCRRHSRRPNGLRIEPSSTAGHGHLVNTCAISALKDRAANRVIRIVSPSPNTVTRLSYHC